MNFRADINGLRAIAVLGVLFFHFMEPWLPGGFAGVDVFFVISGFLMTSIIFKGLDAQRFKLLEFYWARARRIVPALTVLCLVLLVFGWFYLHPADFEALGRHALGSLGFGSNVVYLRESGYFDEASKEKWLLHTWSLSVEWQFYMLYPLALVLLRKFLSMPAIRRLLVLGAVASFALCVYATIRWPSSAFFLLPSRAWEMLVGGLAFLYPLSLSMAARRWLSAIGLALILGAYWGLSETLAWPGYWAALPVFGAYLVIASNLQQSPATGNAVFQWLGTISYSLYLWHWPLVVWLNYSGNGASAVWVAACMALSVLLGAVSYYVVERRQHWGSLAPALGAWMGPNLGHLFWVTAIAGAVVVYQSGFSSRLNPQYLALTEQQVMPKRSNGYCFHDFNSDAASEVSPQAVNCVLGARGQEARVLLFGDSFAGHYEPFWDALGKANGVAINAVTTNWCAPMLGKTFDGPVNHPAYRQCLLNRQVLALDLGRYDLVIFAGQWSAGLKAEYLPEMMGAIRHAAQAVSTVIVMPAPIRYDTNVLKRFQRDLFYQTPFNLTKYTRALDAQEQEAYALLRQDARELGNVIFLEREQLFPPSDTYSKAGYAVPYSLDGMHITLEGSRLLAEDFQSSKVYRQVVQVRLRELLARPASDSSSAR